MTKALSFELENQGSTESERKALFNEVLQNLPENSTSNFYSNQQALDTLGMEFDQLLNLQ